MSEVNATVHDIAKIAQSTGRIEAYNTVLKFMQARMNELDIDPAELRLIVSLVARIEGLMVQEWAPAAELG